MNESRLIRLRRVARAVALLAGLAGAGMALADPSARVARMGYASGEVSLSPAGETDWVRAGINRPLTTGDRLWTAEGARAEVQLGAAQMRLDGGTGISLLNLDDRIAQVQLTQGTLNVRVRRLEPDQVFEVDTPNLAFTLRQPGAYRIEVDADGQATLVNVRQGRGEAWGDGAAFAVDSRQPFRFSGTGLRDYEAVAAPPSDDFDRWSSGRDRGYDNSVAARYVAPDMVGYQDLDANGRWRVDPNYGNVWVPDHVASDWVPYRDGHWAWVDPWGWTWVDDAPWGFAVSHYGRWANLGGTWGWVPGPPAVRAYYAPALVAFVGGDHFQLSVSGGNVGGVGWFPLAPREVYRPSYPTSRGYYENVNRSNTTINNTVIQNTYNQVNVTNIVYANRRVPGAVVAVPSATFVQSQPVGRAALHVPREALAVAAVVAVAPLAPTERSVHGDAAHAGAPPARTFDRPVIGRSAPPAPHAGFAAQQAQLAARPGQPLDDDARRELKPAKAVAPPVVHVVEAATPGPAAALKPPPLKAPAQKAPPAGSDAKPPGQAAAPEAPPARPEDPRRQPEEPKGKPEARPDAGPGSRPGRPAQPVPLRPEATPAPPPLAAPVPPKKVEPAPPQRAEPVTPKPAEPAPPQRPEPAVPKRAEPVPPPKVEPAPPPRNERPVPPPKVEPAPPARNERPVPPKAEPHAPEPAPPAARPNDNKDPNADKPGRDQEERKPKG